MENNLIGRFALSKAGRDRDTLYVIVSQDARFVYLCDGKYHTLNKLKKKALKHVMVCGESVMPKLYGRIINKDRIFDHEIKYAIKLQREGKEEGYVQK